MINYNAVGKDIMKILGLDSLQLVVLTQAGSTLYGTRTPDSDEDYLGIYMPTKKQFLLNEYPKQISVPKEHGIDCQVWSIHYFMKLACQGETLSIDLLHANNENIIACNPNIWAYLKNNRKKFYTKGMKAFVSYARKQAAKYSIKGTRIEAIENVIQYLTECIEKFEKKYDTEVKRNRTFKEFSKEIRSELKLEHYWNSLPKGNHIHFIKAEPYDMYQVAGQKFQETSTIIYVKNRLKEKLEKYGKRAQLARENKGVDWKGISHAIRSAEQVYDILKYGDYDFPLRNAEFIRNVKMGKLDFKNIVQPILDADMNDVEKLMETSDLPDAVDKEFWNDWLMFIMQDEVLNPIY